MKRISSRRGRREHLLTVAIGQWLGRNVVAMRTLGVLSVFAMLAYLVWRALFTGVGVNPVLFGLLLGAEILGWLSLALFVHDAWDQRPLSYLQGEVDGRFAILIPTYDESRDVLEPTLLGATRVRGVDEIWVLDDGHRDWVRELATRYGIKYLARTTNEHAKAGNINHALPFVESDFILILDADHVALPDFKDQTMGYFIDPDVALVQTPHDFRNLDSASHYDNDVNEQSLFFEILQPGRQRSGAVFWCGSGAVIRATALRSVGGLATSTVTEDLETSIKLSRAGWKIVYHNQQLLRGLAPQNLAAYLIQRYRWARGTLQVLLGRNSPIFRGSFPLRTRLSYLSNLVYHFVPIQHVVFIVVIIWSLLSGELPLNAFSLYLLLFWLPQLLLSIVVNWGMSRGRQLPFGGSRNAWLNSGIFIRAILDTIFQRKAHFRVTPKEGIDTGGVEAIRLLWLPTAVSVGLIGATAIRLLHETGIAFTGLPPMQLFAVVIASAFAIFELSILLPLIVTFVRKNQTRTTWREPVNIPALLDGRRRVRVIDLHESGLKLSAESTVIAPWQPGTQLSVELRLKDVNGQRVTAQGVLTIANKYISRETATGSLGGPVVWDTDSDRARVIEHCYVLHPAQLMNSSTGGKASLSTLPSALSARRNGE